MEARVNSVPVRATQISSAKFPVASEPHENFAHKLQPVPDKLPLKSYQQLQQIPSPARLRQ